MVACPVLVGRDAERRRLAGCLEDAERGRGGLVVVTGPPGIGKSRLVTDLVERARGRGDLVLSGAAVREAAEVPFRALADAFIGLELPSDPGLEPWSGLLTGVLPGPAVPGRTAMSVEATPAARAEAVLRLLRVLAATRPVVLLLEDFQWADPDTTAVLEHLIDHLDQERVLVTITAREGALADRLRARHPEAVLVLDPLTTTDVVAMVDACVGPGATTDAGEVDHVVALSKGIPFLVEELLSSPDRAEASVVAMVAGRLAGFDGETQRVVRTAALLGEEVSWRLLVIALSLDEPAVGRALELAHEAGLIRGGAAHAPYAFSHALTREAVIASTPPWVRQQLAREALTALDTQPPGPEETRPEVVALAELADLPDRVAQLHGLAGQEALACGALTTAVAALERAASAAVEEPVRASVLSSLLEAYAAAGRFEECTDTSRTLLALPSLTAAGRAKVHVVLAQASIEATRWSMASTHLVAAAALLEQQPDEATEARRRVLAAEVRLAARELSECAELVDSVLEMAAANADVRCRALALRGRSLRARDLRAAEAAFEAVLATAAAAQLPLWSMNALHELGTIDLFDHSGTERLEEALRTAQAIGALSTATVLHLQLTAAHVFRFEPVAARTHAVQARDSARRLGMRQIEATASVFLAEVAASEVDPEQTEHEIAEAEAALVGDREIAGSAWGARGLVKLFAGDRLGAREPLRRAFERTHEPAQRRAGSIPRPAAAAARRRRRPAGRVGGRRRPGARASRSTVANRGLLALGHRRGSPDGQIARGRVRVGRAMQRVALAAYPVWSDLAFFLVAPCARARWVGSPGRVAASRAASVFARGHQLTALADHSGVSQRSVAEPRNWSLAHARARSCDCVVVGLSNKHIAATRWCSRRAPIEKHVESLLRKTGTRSRDRADGFDHSAARLRTRFRSSTDASVPRAARRSIVAVGSPADRGEGEQPWVLPRPSPTLWGPGARDWSDYNEPMCTPFYEAVLDATGVGPRHEGCSTSAAEAGSPCCSRRGAEPPSAGLDVDPSAAGHRPRTSPAADAARR